MKTRTAGEVAVQKSEDGGLETEDGHGLGTATPTRAPEWGQTGTVLIRNANPANPGAWQSAAEGRNTGSD